MAVLLQTKGVLAETHYYNVGVATSDRSGAGTDADVYVEVFGTNGSHKFLLDKPNYDDFEPGDHDHYLVSCEQDLGTFYAIRVGHDDSGSGSGWHVASVSVAYGGTHNNRIIWDAKKMARREARVEYNKKSRGKKFSIDRWLATDESDGKLSVKVGSLKTEMIQAPEHFTREKAGIHKVKLITPQLSGTTFEISQTVVDEIAISRTSSASSETSATIGMKLTSTAEYLGVEQSLELSAEVSSTVASEIQTAVSKARSLSTTITDQTVFTVPEGKVMGVVLVKYESRAAGKLKVEDNELDFQAVDHSWIEPEVIL
ncbi:MAG: PLAT/LH2 domain-containing protein, partial [Planctomycetota bacterium]